MASNRFDELDSKAFMSFESPVNEKLKLKPVPKNISELVSDSEKYYLSSPKELSILNNKISYSSPIQSNVPKEKLGQKSLSNNKQTKMSYHKKKFLKPWKIKSPSHKARKLEEDYLADKYKNHEILLNIKQKPNRHNGKNAYGSGPGLSSLKIVDNFQSVNNLYFENSIENKIPYRSNNQPGKINFERNNNQNKKIALDNYALDITSKLDKLAVFDRRKEISDEDKKILHGRKISLLY